MREISHQHMVQETRCPGLEQKAMGYWQRLQLLISILLQKRGHCTSLGHFKYYLKHKELLSERGTHIHSAGLAN